MTTLKRYAERKLTVWGADRRACLDRMRRALDETKISGLHTNLRLLRDVVNSAEFIDGSYQPTTRQNERAAKAAPDGSVRGCDLAIIAALLYEQRRHPLPALEAMKMQNEIRAPRPGVIQAIHVEAGRTVGLSEPLIDMN